jgi:hypothetical protein
MNFQIPKMREIDGMKGTIIVTEENLHRVNRVLVIKIHRMNMKDVVHHLARINQVAEFEKKMDVKC